MNSDPASAPPRADLGFLRRRSRPRPAAAPPASGGAPHPVDYTHHETRDRARHAPAAATNPASSRPTIDLSRPGGRGSPSPPERAPTTGRGIDYHRPANRASLDLAAAETAVPRKPAAPPLGVHNDLRVSAGEHLVMGRRTPTVTLTRVQSGVGRLRVEAVCSPDIGDLRLGALYQFRSGGTSVVQYAGGSRFAPSQRRPVIVAGREQYEELEIDLRQIRDIERVTVYAVSESRTPLRWGGTLVLTTFGRARIELPLEELPSGPIAVLVSLYNLHGELVVRTEMESVDGDVREAARAYGYDRITWRDARLPAD